MGYLRIYDNEESTIPGIKIKDVNNLTAFSILIGISLKTSIT